MFIMVIRLYCFHIWLMKHNMTTLEYFLKYKEQSKLQPRNDTRVAPAPVSDIPRKKIKAIDLRTSNRGIDDDHKTSVRNSKNILDNQQAITPRSSRGSHGSGGSTPGHRDTERLPIAQNKPDSTARLLGSASSHRQSGMQRVIINNLQSGSSQLPSLQSKNPLQRNPLTLQKKNLALIQKPVKRLRSGSQEATKTDGILPNSQETGPGKPIKNLPKQLPPLVLGGNAKKTLQATQKQEDSAKATTSGILWAKGQALRKSEKSVSESHEGESDQKSPEDLIKRNLEASDENKLSTPVIDRPVFKSGATSVELLSQSHQPHASVDGSSDSQGPSA